MNSLEALEKLVQLGVKQNILEKYCSLKPGKITEVLKKRTKLDKKLINKINIGLRNYLDEIYEVQINEELEEIQNWCVYMHTFPDEKRYIGISVSPKSRWKEDGSGYANQPKMWEAIQKFGWNNIKHEIILTDLSKETAKEIESALILQYKTTIPALGYNIYY